MADAEAHGADVRGIDETVAALADLDDVPVAEHVERFDAVHCALAEALSTIDGA